MLVINYFNDTHFSPVIPSSRKDDYPETIMSKYRSIQQYSPAPIQIIGGDVFHRSLLPMKYVNWVAEETRKLQEEYQYRTYVISGNHDCSYSNMEYLKESALGNFLATGLVEYLDDLSWEIEPGYEVRIKGWNFNKMDPPEVERQKGVFNTLVGHAFYETSPVLGKDLILTRDQAAESNYDLILLGHDHSKYQNVTVTGRTGPVLICRPGALSRGTSHFTQVWREVSVARVKLEVVDGEIVVDVSNVTIPSIPPEQAFVGKARENNKGEMKKAMEDFVKVVMSTEIDATEVGEMLTQLKVEPKLEGYVRSLLHNYGIIK